jgi:hypothetical protein
MTISRAPAMRHPIAASGVNGMRKRVATGPGSVRKPRPAAMRERARRDCILKIFLAA